VPPPSLSLQFHAAGTEEVLARMRRMTAAGRGWINLEPEVQEDVEVPGVGLFSFMSARGPAVPLCTWSAPRTVRGRRRPPALGIQHGTGTRAVARLAERGLAVPRGWRVSQDHPRRGLVVVVTPAAPEAEMLGWLLRAATLLSWSPPTGTWNAYIYLDGA
jgi:hypothetical protein